MKIEAGKFYKTRDGRTVEVLRTGLDSPYSIIGLLEGRLASTYYDNGRSSFDDDPGDLVAEWQEPFKSRMWANVYPEGVVVAHGNEAAARDCRGESGRTIRVDIIEVTTDATEPATAQDSCHKCGRIGRTYSECCSTALGGS